MSNSNAKAKPKNAKPKNAHTKECRVPGCEKKVNGRGVCSMHFHRAARGLPGPAKDEALRYILPSKCPGRVARATAARTAAETADGPPDQTARTDAEQAELDALIADPLDDVDDGDGETAAPTTRATRHARAATRQRLAGGGVELEPHSRDEQIRIVIATVGYFATELGLGRPSLNEPAGERTWVGVSGNELMMDADGRLHHVRRKVGPPIDV